MKIQLRVSLQKTSKRKWRPRSWCPQAWAWSLKALPGSCPGAAVGGRDREEVSGDRLCKVGKPSGRLQTGTGAGREAWQRFISDTQEVVWFVKAYSRCEWGWIREQ